MEGGSGLACTSASRWRCRDGFRGGRYLGRGIDLLPFEGLPSRGRRFSEVRRRTPGNLTRLAALWHTTPAHDRTSSESAARVQTAAVFMGTLALTAALRSAGDRQQRGEDQHIMMSHRGSCRSRCLSGSDDARAGCPVRRLQAMPVPGARRRDGSDWKDVRVLRQETQRRRLVPVNCGCRDERRPQLPSLDELERFSAVDRARAPDSFARRL